jgi:hypothetical protein
MGTVQQGSSKPTGRNHSRIIFTLFCVFISIPRVRRRLIIWGLYTVLARCKKVLFRCNRGERLCKKKQKILKGDHTKKISKISEIS